MSRNRHVAEIVSETLNIEAEGVDRTVRDFTARTGLDHTGIDVRPSAGSDQRTVERECSSTQTRWDRTTPPLRVINGVTEASTHQPWHILLYEVVYNTNADRFLLAIDSLKHSSLSSAKHFHHLGFQS